MFSINHSLKQNALMNEDKTSGKTNAETVISVSGLTQLFELELMEIYWAEKALVEAIPKIIKGATAKELVRSLQDHLSVTNEQVSRLEQVFEIADKRPLAKKCASMEGLIKEAEEFMYEAEKGMVRDAAIISCVQKIEHYEIASYGTLCSFATTLGLYEAANLLAKTLNEEKDADVTLTGLAENYVNHEIVNGKD